MVEDDIGDVSRIAVRKVCRKESRPIRCCRDISDTNLFQ
jgi:hypothetical protein